MSLDYGSAMVLSEPMKISTGPMQGRWDVNMQTSGQYDIYCMGDQMKYAIAASAIHNPQSLLGVQGEQWCSWPWPGASMPHGEARWEEPAKICMPTSFDAVPQRYAKSSLQIQKDDDDGYDSSHSTSCETSACSESLTSSWDAASILESAELSPIRPPPGLGFDVGSVPTRPSRQRQLGLNDLSWAERANLILPVISGWGRILGLTKSVASIGELQRLISEHPATREIQSRKARMPEDTETLKKTLQELQIQELLEKLGCQEAPPSVQISIDTLAFEIQQEITKVKRRGQGSKSKRQR
jgi:hypothetical protein